MSLAQRLYWVRWRDEHGRLAAPACRRFAISRETLNGLVGRYARLVGIDPVALADRPLTADEAVAIAEAILRAARRGA
ncbi:MAG: hypothetical protein FJZ92_06375 [Chloroflexi bacterium]|nr:hypothetical protein [Chloroflexota bacterium]